MQGTGHQVPAYRFGAFELDTRSGDLRKLGIRIKLQEQPREILLLLLENAGEVVTREQIQKHLWPDSTFVDFSASACRICSRASLPRFSWAYVIASQMRVLSLSALLSWDVSPSAAASQAR